MIAYLTAIATLVGVRALVTLGLNVQWGMAGLVNLGAVAFFAVGAYTSALLAVGGTPLLFAWPAAVGLAAAAGAGLAMVALRLREDYLAIVTLGAGVAGIAGILFAHYLAYVEPNMFLPQESLFVWLALILGGSGNNRGALLGSVVLLGLLEGSRFAKDLIPFLTGVRLVAAQQILVGG